MNHLAGAHAVVTGGSRGIGRSIASLFLSSGASVSVIGRDKNHLTSVLAELTPLAPQKVAVFSCDISDREQVSLTFDACRNTFGPISVLVNNAGIGSSSPFHKVSDTDWQNVISVNLSGVFYCTRAVLPEMLQAKKGRIINIASTAGVTGYRYVSAYCAAKHGVVGLTRSLALEVAAQGITVNAICPGFTETDILWDTLKNSASKTGKSEDQIRAELLRSNPSGRFVKAEEIASAALWLAGDDARSITGQTLVVAGGEVL